jgi:hypothetical protein
VLRWSRFASFDAFIWRYLGLNPRFLEIGATFLRREFRVHATTMPATTTMPKKMKIGTNKMFILFSFF